MKQPDVQQALVRMSGDLADALSRLRSWAADDARGADGIDLQDAAIAARLARRDLARRVADSFLLPIDPEEVLELSERLEAAITAVYLLQREMVLLGVHADDDVIAIFDLVVPAAKELNRAFSLLTTSPDEAADLAEDVLDKRWEVDDAYARLIQARSRAAAPGAPGPAQREVARRAEELMERVAHVARRVVHTVAKRG